MLTTFTCFKIFYLQEEKKNHLKKASNVTSLFATYLGTKQGNHDRETATA